jgi:hypothetical protein
MSQDNVRRSMERFIVGPFESVSLDRWVQQVLDLGDHVSHVLVGNLERVVLEKMVDSYQEVGDGMEPREPGIVLEQVEKGLNGLYRSADSFIGGLLRDNECAMQTHQTFTDRQHGPAA